MVTRKREFAFQGTGAVKHSRLPPRSPRQVIKALLNWFLFPVELFYLTKNRQNIGTNNESGLLDRNSLRTVSIVAFSYFSLLSLSLVLPLLLFSLDSSPPVFPSKTSTTTTTVHGGNANYFLVSRPRHAGSTTKRDRRRRESRFSSGSFKPCVRF